MFVKLIGFSDAQFLSNDRLLSESTKEQLDMFSSPEQALKLDCDDRVDVWSATLIIYNLLSHDFPFNA